MNQYLICTFCFFVNLAFRMKLKSWNDFENIFADKKGINLSIAYVYKHLDFVVIQHGAERKSFIRYKFIYCLCI